MATMSKEAARRKRKRLKKQGKSGIVIRKPGSFTAWCKSRGFGGVTQACIAAGKRSSSAAIRKKATFADNAKNKFNKGKSSS